MRFIVYTINEQIPQRHSTISTYRDMYLEVTEYFNDINSSIYGLPAIWSFIGSNISHVLIILYYGLIFPGSENIIFYFDNIIAMSMRLVNVILLFGIGDAIEKEVFIIFFLHHKAIIFK